MYIRQSKLSGEKKYCFSIYTKFQVSYWYLFRKNVINTVVALVMTISHTTDLNHLYVFSAETISQLIIS